MICSHKLELKERECLRLENHWKNENKESCLTKIHSIKKAIRGLHLRRTELQKDCVAKHDFVENIKDPNQAK